MGTNQDGTTSGVVSDAHSEDKTTRGDCPPNSGGNWVNPDKPSLIQKCFPTGLKQELKQLIKISWPIISGLKWEGLSTNYGWSWVSPGLCPVSYHHNAGRRRALTSFFTFSFTPIALIFCGHLGKEELDAAALATSAINATGIFVCVGLCLACDTLFSQAFGGQNLKMLGIHYQKSLIIMSLACCLCWSIHLNAEPIFILLRQDPEISKLAADYMLFFAPGLFCNFVFQVSVKFLQSQNVVIPVTVLGLMGNLFNVAAQYVFVYTIDLKTRGSAIAQTLSWFVTCLLTLLYIWYCGLFRSTLGGCSWKVLEDWGHFLKLAIAGLVMTIAELCTIESGIFLNGVFGVVEQGAMSISLQIDWCLYVITLGLGVACSIRVGHNLGAGDGQGAKTAFRVALFTLFCLNFVTTILLVSLKDVAGLLFTSDRDVVEMVSKILPILIVVQASDVVYGVCSGALRGCGQQWKGGVLNFVGYCFISVPAIVVFMFYTKLGALGFWWGIVAGMVPIAVVYVIIVFRIDWQKEAVKASRNNKEVLDTSLTTKSESTITEFGARDFRKVPSGENHICDEDKELSQPISQKSTEDTSLIDNDKTSGRRKPHLIITRLVTCGVVIVILVASICVRLFVKS